MSVASSVPQGRSRNGPAMLARELNGANMADTPAKAKAARRGGNWRHRENRASPKFVSKRVSEEDHEALTKYARDHGVKVAEMLDPFVNDLIRRAREYCEQGRRRLGDG